MAERAYIFGAGGHAHVIASFLDAEPRFLVEGEPSGPEQMRQADYVARIDELRGAPVYIGIGQNAARQRVFEQLVGLGVTPAIAIAPGAFIARSADIAPGAVICAGAVVGARAHVGANAIVNTLSSLDHDCRLGDHSQITCGVSIAGTVTIGKNCFFGTKSAVIPNITIGDDVVVMAGSLVVRDVGDRVMVGGSPAKVMREL